MDQHIKDHGLLMENTNFNTVDAAVDAAQTFYEDKGKSGLDLSKEVAVAKGTAAVELVWYCDEHGFVQSVHPQGRLVTLVGMYVNEEVA